MGTLTENLQAIIDSKAAIKASISNKGVTVPIEAKLNALPALIDSISQDGISSGSPEITDVVFVNPVDNAKSTNIDVVLKIMSNGANANYGVQYRQVGTTNWIEGGTAVVTNNIDAKTLHAFDKIATVTLTGLLYQQSWDNNLWALRENNNRYEVRAYIVGDTNNYTTPRIYTTGWSKYFDNIYEAANDLEKDGTKKKRAIAVINTASKSTTLSQLGGNYFKTSDGYLGVSWSHIFDESRDIPIYNEDGINIKYYVRWVILYTDVATANITINDTNPKKYLYCYFGDCTPNITFSLTNIENIRFSSNVNITSISAQAFNSCYSLSSINIPNSVTSIGYSAFYGCSSLSSIVIPDSVTNIGSSTFSNCYSLSSIVVPNSVTIIGWNAFNNCYSLSSIIIPNSVTTIDDSAFVYCSSLSSIIIPNSVTTIGNTAFQSCTSLSSIIIPNSVTDITDYTFQHCSSLYSVVIPNSVTDISESAFYGCSSLSSINIPNSVTSIKPYSFYACTSLSSIVIPDSVTHIGAYAFSGCTSLSSVVIPDSITHIESSIFQSCSSLSSVTLLSIPTSFPTSSIIHLTKKVYNVSIPAGWDKAINLVAGPTSSDNVLTHRCMLDIFNKLKNGVTGLIITLGSTNLARMSANEIAIATNKGWTVQ